jgi:hypothetical protein
MFKASEAMFAPLRLSLDIPTPTAKNPVISAGHLEVWDYLLISGFLT